MIKKFIVKSNEWYDNFSEIPDIINWRGESFEVTFGILKARLNKIRRNRRLSNGSSKH